MDEKKLDKDINVRSKELTDEEIVKALEFKAEFNAKVGYVDGTACKFVRVADILDLIHRLQGEKAEYENKLADGELVSKDWHDEQVMLLRNEYENEKLFNLAIKNGEVDFSIESETTKSFYYTLVQIFEQNGAKNFFTTSIDIDGKKGRYSFTIEKVGGQTVAEKLAEQKAEIERLKGEKNDWKQRYDSESNRYADLCNASSECVQKKNDRIAELQKQVEELTAKRKRILANKVYSDSTLKGWKKEDLIEQIRILEHNWASAEESLNIQAKNCEMLLKQAVKDTAKEIYDYAKDFFEWDEEGFVSSLKYALKDRYGVEVE